MSAPSTPPPAGRARTWACFFAPPAAWYFFQQGLGMVVRVDCGRAGAPWGMAFGLAAVLVCALAAGFAAPFARAQGATPQLRTRRFVARVALGLAGVFALAAIYQTAAVILVPSCVR